jgi:hypothetical protein
MAAVEGNPIVRIIPKVITRLKRLLFIL